MKLGENPVGRLFCHGDGLRKKVAVTRKLSSGFLVSIESSVPSPSGSWYQNPPRTELFYPLTWCVYSRPGSLLSVYKALHNQRKEMRSSRDTSFEHLQTIPDSLPDQLWHKTHLHVGVSKPRSCWPQLKKSILYAPSLLSAPP